MSKREPWLIKTWDNWYWWGDKRDFPTEEQFRDAIGEEGVVTEVTLNGCRRSMETDGDCQAIPGEGMHYHPAPYGNPRIAQRQCWQMERCRPPKYITAEQK